MSDTDRSGDWDWFTLVGEKSDPVPWTFIPANSLRFHYQQLAEACEEASEDVRAVKSGDIGKGETVDALQDLVGQLPKLLDDAAESFGQAADAFDKWSELVERLRPATEQLVINAQAAYDELEDKDDWEKENLRDLYFDEMAGYRTELDTVETEVISELNELLRGGLEKAWDLWNNIVEWTEDNPIIYAVVMVAVGIVAVFVPVIGIALALAALAVTLTSLHRKDKLGWNMEAITMIALDLVSLIPGAAVIKGGAMLGMGASFLARNSGRAGAAINGAANSLRASTAGTTISNVVSSASTTRAAINQGTWRGSSGASLAADIGLSSAREATLSTAADVTIQVASGQDISAQSLAQSALMGAATGAPGGAVGAMHDHNAFSAMGGDGSLTGTETNISSPTGDTASSTMGANDIAPDSSSPAAAQGDAGGVTSDFSGDGGGTFSSGDGVTTTISASGGEGANFGAAGDGGGNPPAAGDRGDTVPTFTADPPTPAADFSAPASDTPAPAQGSVQGPDSATTDLPAAEGPGAPADASSGPEATTPRGDTESAPASDPVAPRESNGDGPAPQREGDPAGEGGPRAGTATQAARTSTGDGTDVSTRFDGDGNVVDTTINTGNPREGTGTEFTHDPNSGTTRIETSDGLPQNAPESADSPNGRVETIHTTHTSVTDSGTSSRGEYGDIGFTRTDDGTFEARFQGEDLRVSFPNAGEAVVGTSDGGSVPVRSEDGGVRVGDDTGGVVIRQGGDPGIELPTTDGLPDLSLSSSDQAVSVAAAAGAVTAVRTSGGTDIRNGQGARVNRPDDAGKPTTIRPDGSRPTTLTTDRGTGITLGAEGGNTTVHDPVGGRSTQFGDSHYRVGSADGSHRFDAVNRHVTAETTGSQGTAGTDRVEIGGKPGTDGAGIRLNADTNGNVGGHTGGTDFGISPETGTTAVHGDTTLTSSPDGRTTLGDVRVEPDGTVHHPDFTLHPDGSSAVRDPDGGSTDHPPASEAGTRLESRGAEVSTQPDPAGGTRTSVRSEGWTFVRNGDGSTQIRPPEDADGTSVTISRTRDGQVEVVAGGYSARVAGGEAVASSPDSLNVTASERGGQAQDGTHVTRVGPDGDGQTRSTDPDGAVLASHTDGQGQIALPDGITVTHTPEGGSARLAPDSTSGVVSGDTVIRQDPDSGVRVEPDGPDAPWRVEAGNDGVVRADSGADTRIESRPDGSAQARSSHGGRPFHTEVGVRGDVRTTDVRDGTSYLPFRGGAEVRGSDGNAAVRINDHTTRVVPASGRPQSVDFAPDGSVEQIRVNGGGRGQPVHTPDGRVTVQGDSTSTVSGPDGIRHSQNNNRSNVTVGETTTIQRNPFFGSGSTTTHGGSPDALVNVAHDGSQQSFDAGGATSQSLTESGTGSGRSPRSTRAEVTRTGETTRVEQVYSRVDDPRGPVTGPTMTRDTGTDTSTVSHGGYEVAQRPGAEGGRDVTVRTGDSLPEVTCLDNGTAIVRSDELSVRSNPVADDGPTVKVEPAKGDENPITVERSSDGTITVREGDKTVVQQKPGEKPVIGEGEWKPGTDTTPTGARVETFADQSVTLRRTDGDGTVSTTVRPDGGFSYRSPSNAHQVNVSPNGLPTHVNNRPNGDTSTTTQFGNGTIDIQSRDMGPRSADGETQTTHSTTRIGTDGSVESRIRRPNTSPDHGPLPESWTVGVDSHGQATTVNNRTWTEAPLRLNEHGSLREIRTPAEATHGDKKPSSLPWIHSREDLRVIAENMRWEVVKSFANVAGGFIATPVVQEFSEHVLGMEEDEIAPDASLEMAFAQIATALPKGSADEAYTGTAGLPEFGPGQIPWRFASEFGHQAMRNRLVELWEQGESPEEHTIEAQISESIATDLGETAEEEAAN
ncbi:hypothetical protein GCM10007079_48640 [Nocardiopsis terrae]|uniref:Uncharacterized protein n=1 Tax=Nocardiopsis terrae TaxID=372655 RepID=A0ABR9HAF5_9ACTN|nr:hypothetical protein [Nocardiopsis terrae]MBE1456019.1 hypothetical protein [Nocardiopsis terrae]GHC96252.1 hypothetical protein GCM10007079_48640 [Nocardiopsis terrae]